MLRVIARNTASDDPEPYRERRAARVPRVPAEAVLRTRALVTLLHELAAESRRLWTRCRPRALA